MKTGIALREVPLMKTVIRKAYWNYEKEEKWLNEMSAKGFALIDYSWCRYVFTDSKEGEYIYRIEMLEHLPSHPVSQKYLQFMEESGVEHIASYMRWAYFRKKASDGVFDIYSDIGSKIKHFQRINLFWVIMACAELLIGVSNILIGISNIPIWAGSSFRSHYNLFSANIIGGLVCVCFGIGFIALSRPVHKKIKKLKKDKMIME